MHLIRNVFPYYINDSVVHVACYRKHRNQNDSLVYTHFGNIIVPTSTGTPVEC